MPNIDLLKDSRDIEGITDSIISALPKGFLYESDELRDFFKGFMGVYQDVMLTIEKSANDLFYLDEDSLYLEEFLVMYGLPNVLFPDIQTKAEAVFAISMMKLSSTLLSKEDYENFLALLGFNVTFYSVNGSVLENQTFNYNFPIAFSNSISYKDKLTYWVYVEEDDSSGIGTDFNNIGDAFDLDFVSSQNKLQEVEKILDFLKPDYLIFQYISLYTKNIYGL